jgi:hypothetical protein
MSEAALDDTNVLPTEERDHADPSTDQDCICAAETLNDLTIGDIDGARRQDILDAQRTLNALCIQTIMRSGCSSAVAAERYMDVESIGSFQLASLLSRATQMAKEPSQAWYMTKKKVG